MKHTALLALEDGSLFHGRSIGTDGNARGEVVFNTAITGYQEIITDPSYCQQIVTLTQPHIGIVGVNAEDDESGSIKLAGLVIRDLPVQTSSWRSEQTLDTYLRAHHIVAIADIDTRRLTRILRDKGAQNGCIVAGENIDEVVALKQAGAFPGLKGMDLAQVVTTKEKYDWHQGCWDSNLGLPERAANANKHWHVIAYDFGVKRNILRIVWQTVESIIY